MKYPNEYGEDRTPITQEDAEKGMNAFIEAIHEHMPEIKEKSFWLCLQNEMWCTYADSVKENCKGELIKEFKV